MILQKKTINNVPTLVPLTADTGSGVPVGTIIGQYKKVNMAGYLYLDGSTFDQTLYPALYAYLGTNVLPDYREFVLVGAEQNTTSATIADHDVFTQGQEKDDQLQDHSHRNYVNGDPNFEYKLDQGKTGTGSGWGGGTNFPLIASATTGRTGTTTRTKEKAVFWYIKATTGIIESEATEMLNVINENNSYSTNEIATGKTWIDGKPIYRKVIDCGTSTSNKNVVAGISNLENVVDLRGIATPTSPTGGIQPLPWSEPTNYQFSLGLRYYKQGDYINILNSSGSYTIIAIIEYTKTTD